MEGRTCVSVAGRCPQGTKLPHAGLQLGPVLQPRPAGAWAPLGLQCLWDLTLRYFAGE